MKQAQFILEKYSNSGAQQHLYRLSPPLEYEGNSHEYVIVSAILSPFSGPETYIFPSNEQGEVTSWGELPGSTRGILNHKKALRNMGYKVVAVRD